MKKIIGFSLILTGGYLIYSDKSKRFSDIFKVVDNRERCPDCSVVVDDLREHLISEHKDRKVKCIECRKDFDSVEEFYMHKDKDCGREEIVEIEEKHLEKNTDKNEDKI